MLPMPATKGAKVRMMGQEAGDDDGLAAVLLVEGMGAVQVFLVEKAAVLLMEHLGACVVTTE